MTSEDKLIGRVRRRFTQTRHRPQVGIGDDAAVLAVSGGTEWVVTTDAFLENVHFLRRVHPAKAIGYKALARATSDIAAMGAHARYFFLTLGLPSDCSGLWLDQFLAGMSRGAQEFGLTLAGGDTTSYPLVIISLTVVGEVDRGRAILRSGARPGDLLCVSGTLGEAELGLRLILANSNNRRGPNSLLKKHFYPEPRLKLGEWLNSRHFATSMIDTSDGLSTDLSHLCKASGVGAVVWAPKIPTVRIPPKLQKQGLNPLQLALNGGEDYELLFTVPRRLISRLPRRLGNLPITLIGEITRTKKILIEDEDKDVRIKPLKPGGWDPFRTV
jgi:thiamine-monophosphate kinase